MTQNQSFLCQGMLFTMTFDWFSWDLDVKIAISLSRCADKKETPPKGCLRKYGNEIPDQVGHNLMSLPAWPVISYLLSAVATSTAQATLNLPLGCYRFRGIPSSQRVLELMKNPRTEHQSASSSMVYLDFGLFSVQWVVCMMRCQLYLSY